MCLSLRIKYHLEYHPWHLGVSTPNMDFLLSIVKMNMTDNLSCRSLFWGLPIFSSYKWQIITLFVKTVPTWINCSGKVIHCIASYNLDGQGKKPQLIKVRFASLKLKHLFLNFTFNFASHEWLPSPDSAKRFCMSLASPTNSFCTSLSLVTLQYGRFLVLVMAPSVFRLRQIHLSSFHTVQSAIAGQSGTCGVRGEEWQAASDTSHASSSLHLGLAFLRVSTLFLGSSKRMEAF